jgi:predicted MPP superfamily phosphohydrolase
MQEKPDLILMAGDYLQADSEQDWEKLCVSMRDYLRKINFAAPLGVCGVGGNTDFQRWPEIFEGLDVQRFRETRTVAGETFDVTGLSIEDSFDPGLVIRRPSAEASNVVTASIQASSRSRNSERLHIVLGHAPDYALSGQMDADLLIAGHTHGGQVRLPWIGPLVTFSRVPRAWAAGHTQLDGDRHLVVSRGVGMERRDAPRLRFLCRPQLVFIDVVPE